MERSESKKSEEEDRASPDEEEDQRNVEDVERGGVLDQANAPAQLGGGSSSAERFSEQPKKEQSTGCEDDQLAPPTDAADIRLDIRGVQEEKENERKVLEDEELRKENKAPPKYERSASGVGIGEATDDPELKLAEQKVYDRLKQHQEQVIEAWKFKAVFLAIFVELALVLVSIPLGIFFNWRASFALADTALLNSWEQTDTRIANIAIAGAEAVGESFWQLWLQVYVFIWSQENGDNDIFPPLVFYISVGFSSVSIVYAAAMFAMNFEAIQRAFKPVRVPAEELLEIGKKHRKAGEFGKAVKNFKFAADQGYADAQTCLGYCYQNGQGVPKDLEEAVRLYRLAADQGHADAQRSLDLCYQNAAAARKAKARQGDIAAAARAKYGHLSQAKKDTELWDGGDDDEESRMLCGNENNNDKESKGVSGKRRASSSSNYRGVYRNQRNKSKPWQVQIWIDGKCKYFGTYATEEEAARAYDAEGARLGRVLNFPEEWKNVEDIEVDSCPVFGLILSTLLALQGIQYMQPSFPSIAPNHCLSPVARGISEGIVGKVAER